MSHFLFVDPHPFYQGLVLSCVCFPSSLSVLWTLGPVSTLPVQRVTQWGPTGAYLLAAFCAQHKALLVKGSAEVAMPVSGQLS